jgi:hypothetical protein
MEHLPLPNDDFLRVSADTKTCGSPLNLSPTGVSRLPSGKHRSILTGVQTQVKKKVKKIYRRER